MRSLFQRSLMAVTVTTLTATVAVAQVRPTPRPSRAVPRSAGTDSLPTPRRGGPPSMESGRRGGGPGFDALRLREQLELTDEQVKKLEALRSAGRPQLNQADMLRAQADLMDATKGDVNLEKARSAYDRMARLRTDVQLSQLKLRQDARNVLTPAQRAKADALQASMRGRRADAIRRAARGASLRGRADRPGARMGTSGRGQSRDRASRGAFRRGDDQQDRRTPPGPGRIRRGGEDGPQDGRPVADGPVSPDGRAPLNQP